jgi:hypothetical protein
VVNTAGYPDAGGRHTNANMKGIGRFFGHGHPCGGLHLHHYKQQFFSKQKNFFLPKQGKGVLWYTTTISDPSFSNPDPLKFHQTHQSISSDPSIPLEPSISSRPCSKFCKPIQKKKIHFLSNNIFF